MKAFNGAFYYFFDIELEAIFLNILYWQLADTMYSSIKLTIIYTIL